MAGVIIVVGNLKGGTGKTTLAINLAAGLVGAQIVDADAQRSATGWSESGALPFPVHALPLEHRQHIARWIAQVRALADDRDHLVIDLPPHVGAAAQAALAVADVVACPVGPSILDLRAARHFLELVDDARAERGADRPRALLVPSRVDRRLVAGRDLPGALKQLGAHVAPSIGQRTAFADAATVGESVLTYAPRSIAAGEIKALVRAVKGVLNG